MKLTTIFLKLVFSLLFFVSGLTFAMQLSDETPEPDNTESEINNTENIDADNPGMTLINQAIEEKLKASNEQDLNNVLALAQRARKEGLQGANLKFCDEFIASVQIQRGILLSSRIVSKSVERLPESWTVIRTRALNDLETATKTIKTQPEVFIRIAQLHLMPGGDKNKAKKALDEAENISKNQPDIFAQVVIIKTMLENDPVKREKLLANATKNVEDQRLIFFHAMSLIDLKKFKEAIDPLDKILKDQPNNTQALQLKFEAHRNLKQFEEALEILDKFENTLSLDAVALLRAKIFVDMGKKNDAIKILDKLHEKLQDNIEVMLLRASLLSDMKQYDKAIKDIDNVIKLVGEDKEQQIQPLKILKVQILNAAEKFDEATQILNDLEKNMPEDIGVKILKVEIFHNNKKYKEALEIIDSLLKDNPGNLVFLRLKGNILLSLRRHSEAVKIFEEIIKIDPTDKTALNNLSWVLSTSTIDMVRNGKRALELAKRACELTDYKVAYILSTLAAAYAENGDFKKAIEYSQKSIDLSADDPNVNERIEDLKKELETYKQNQPYRELPK